MKDKSKREATLIALETEIHKRYQDYVDRMPPGPRAAQVHFMQAFLDGKAKHKKEV
jgi:hypothetical protein